MLYYYYFFVAFSVGDHLLVLCVSIYDVLSVLDAFTKLVHLTSMWADVILFYVPNAFNF